MILGNLTFSNFSVYAARQTVDLAPKRTQPVVLIGGLNGAGKTSLLTAIRIALFGKRIVQMADEKRSYTALLRDLIHDPDQGPALVELEFYSYTLGEKETYRVSRSWSLRAGKIHEELHTLKDGREDEVLASTWDDFIDSLMPASIAHLFFFDGEKVADMADADGARNLLRTGVQSLLGIDMLTRLQDDLGDLMSKKLKSHDGSEALQQLDGLEKISAELNAQLESLAVELADGDDIVKELLARLVVVDDHFRETGALLFAERSSIEQELLEARHACKVTGDALVELVSGPLPLALVEELLQVVQTQDQREQEASKAAAVLDVLESRDAEILEILQGGDPALQKQIKTYIERDKAQRSETAGAETYLCFSAEARGVLYGLDGALAESKAVAVGLLSRYEADQARVLDAERRMGMIPPEAVVRDVIEERDQVLSSLAEKQERLKSLKRKREQIDATIEHRKKEKERLLRQIAASQAEETIDSRVTRYAQKARDRAHQFEEKLLLHSLARLESFILDSLQQLLRKERLVCGVSIGAKDFSLNLWNGSGVPISLDRLSAGEGQLVIIAILWGLGRASGRPLPLIIDTPLGRLDSKHRENLLESYFPTASHQTILLTTDTEITRSDYGQLREFTGKTYRLEHNDATRQTTIMPGYFWS